MSLTTGPADGPVYTLTILTLAVPLLFGMFWGSPAVARERDTGTVQFAWTQSVTIRRWLSLRTGWLLLAGAVFGGAVAGLVTWWYAPLNALHQNQFQQGYFDLQGIVPIGYAVFAVALGIAAGTPLGRSLPALAVTAGVFACLACRSRSRGISIGQVSAASQSASLSSSPTVGSLNPWNFRTCARWYSIVRPDQS